LPSVIVPLNQVNDISGVSWTATWGMLCFCPTRWRFVS
jgi:hypothetical protein